MILWGDKTWAIRTYERFLVFNIPFPFISILDLFKYHSNYFNHSKKIVIELDENITMYNEKIETINIYIDNE